MSEKTIYTINKYGKNYFNELMGNYYLTPPQIYLDFTAVISNIGKRDEAIRKQRK